MVYLGQLPAAVGPEPVASAVNHRSQPQKGNRFIIQFQRTEHRRLGDIAVPDDAMSPRIKVATVDEFEGNGSRVITEVRGKEIAVFLYDGEFYAVANYCIHQSGPLCEGGLTGYMTLAEDGWDWAYDPEEKYVSCPWHGWAFDITSGKNVKDARFSVPTFDVEVEGDEVHVVI